MAWHAVVTSAAPDGSLAAEAILLIERNQP